MKRVVLKISGEALKDENKNVSENKLKIVCDTVRLLKENDYNVGIVVGGGNFFRGRENPHMDEVTRDTIGMLGTVTNALYLKDYLNRNNIKTEVYTPFSFPGLLEEYNKNTIYELSRKGYTIVFGGGVGKSGYSTDSGTILACDYIDADLIIKMTNVNGVFDSDPDSNKFAKKFDYISYEDVIEKKLGIMDEYAIKKCMENNIRILVINFNDYKDIIKSLSGNNIGTIIGE